MPMLPVCSAWRIYIIFLNEACARDVGYITSQCRQLLSTTCRHHGRLVKGLQASAHRNPCKRIFLGMWEGVGGKQQGQGRCGERYNPFLHLVRPTYSANHRTHYMLCGDSMGTAHLL